MTGIPFSLHDSVTGAQTCQGGLSPDEKTATRVYAGLPQRAASDLFQGNRCEQCAIIARFPPKSPPETPCRSPLQTVDYLPNP
jgi:hypothetical protein